MGNYGYGEEAMPGATLFSYVMFPLRIAFFSFFFCLLYPLMTVVALLRALYLRLVVGTTSQVLKYGTYPPPKPAADGTMMSPPGKHEKANHYPAQMRFTKPFDEAKLKAALVSVAAEDGIPEDQIQLKFMAEVPQEPSSGSYDPGPDLLPGTYKKGYCYSNDIFFPPFGTCTGTQRLLMHVYNGKPGKTTVVHYGGSVCGWDGSSQFNFVKEVMRRYSDFAELHLRLSKALDASVLPSLPPKLLMNEDTDIASRYLELDAYLRGLLASPATQKHGKLLDFLGAEKHGVRYGVRRYEYDSASSEGNKYIRDDEL